MAGLKATEKLPAGSIPWLAEERAAALKIAQEESEDFVFCARNEAEWLNEHVAEIFSENHLSVKDIFKTPGKLRGKTPHTVRKRNPLETRAPLTDVFSATPRGEPNPFRQIHFEKPTSKFQVAQDLAAPSEDVRSPDGKPAAAANKSFYDSGYHGRQNQTHAEEEPMEIDETDLPLQSPQQLSPLIPHTLRAKETLDLMKVETGSEETRTTGELSKSANEEQSLAIIKEGSKRPKEIKTSSAPIVEESSRQTVEEIDLGLQASPGKMLPERSDPPQEPVQRVSAEAQTLEEPAEENQSEERPVSREADVTFDDAQSPSEGSSPIRPIVRKSSLSFASLPAREPLTTKQSIGNRISRTSHLDQTRQSYFGRPTGGKSLGNVPQVNAQQEVRKEDAIKAELDEEVVTQKPEPSKEESDVESNILQIYDKTLTQRLQDQISKLGQSQSNTHRPSQSIPSSAAASQLLYPQIVQQAPEESSASQKAGTTVLPGAFPEDEDESWIGPPHAAEDDFTKANSADARDGVESVGAKIPPQQEVETRHNSPVRETVVPERPMSVFSDTKSLSNLQNYSPKKDEEHDVESAHRKGISVSNPMLASAQETSSQSSIPPASPTRNYRDSPLKASKEKLSSMLKFSKGLFASSTAASAEAKFSDFTPASKRLADQPSMPPHAEHILTQTATDHDLYPNLTQNTDEAIPASPTKPATGRNTRASNEREERRKEKEAKEAQRMVAQLDKLEKAREKEKQRARELGQEKEKAAAAEKQEATQKEQDLTNTGQIGAQRSTRNSPRKTKAQLEAEGRAAAALPASKNDFDGSEISVSMPPPALPKTMMTSQIGKPKDLLKRPGRPPKESASTAKKAPMIIRVDTGSQRNQNYPSNSTLAASLQASLAPSASVPCQPGIKGKSSSNAISTKASTNSFSSSVSSNGPNRPRALDIAARKKEQDEREAQRKREIKLENERKLEEKRQEQQRRKEAERQREKEREQLEARKASQATKQALLKRKEVEMAKLQRPPPPPMRIQANDDKGRLDDPDKLLPSLPQRMNPVPPRPATRMDAARSQDDLSRPMNMGFHNTTKAPPKRPFQQDAGDEMASRTTMQRSGPSYQQNEGKRRKTGEGHQELDVPEVQPRQMAPPIRQSSIRPKDGPTKALFSNGYTHAPSGPHVGPSLHKGTLQHLHQNKPAHPMDLAQTSKATISFATSSNQPAAGPSYKTPARPAGTIAVNKSTAKSQARSSPRYQNGEDINLPEIHTDSEDEDEEGGEEFAVPDWADSPALRDQLAAQDSIDPAEVFGPMPELKMEEIFKNKDRWNRFRARTSSANWSGSDRLTEEEIRKDLEGRERLRKEGGWTYGLGG